MLKPLIILGAGGHAEVLIDLAEELGHSILGITTRDLGSAPKTLRSYPVIGDDEALLRYLAEDVELVNGVGSTSSTQRRKELFLRFAQQSFRFVTLVHPSAVVSPTAALGQGAQIMAGTVICTGANIGRNVLVNTRSSVDHHCTIGDHAHLAPGVTLSGNVTIGQGCHLGTGAIVLQGVQLGRDTLVAAGAVVLKSFPDNSRLKGIPATLF